MATLWGHKCKWESEKKLRDAVLRNKWLITYLSAHEAGYSISKGTIRRGNFRFFHRLYQTALKRPGLAKVQFGSVFVSVCGCVCVCIPSVKCFELLCFTENEHPDWMTYDHFCWLWGNAACLAHQWHVIITLASSCVTPQS